MRERGDGGAQDGERGRNGRGGGLGGWRDDVERV